jgi:hypothetical protein
MKLWGTAEQTAAILLLAAVAACRTSATPPPDAGAGAALVDASPGAAIDGAGAPDDAGGAEVARDAPPPVDRAASADAGPLSCDQLLLELNNKHMMALACVPMKAGACKSAVEALCGCSWVVGDPGSPETLAFKEAVRAYKSAGCVPPCPEAGACPAANGFCTSPGQARPPVFSCS